MADALRNKILNELYDVLLGKKFLSESLEDAEITPYFARLLRGTVEREVTLTAILCRVSSVKPEKMKPLMRSALLMGLYELLYMDTPDYAVVNETVELLKKRGFRNLTGFANGILRRVSREKEELFAGLRKSETVSLSPLIFRILSKTYGVEATMKMGEAFLREEKGLTIRRNRSICTETELRESLSADGASLLPFSLTPEENDTSDDFFLLQTEKSPESLKAFQVGYFYIQDAAPYLAYRDVLKDLTTQKTAVLDLSASPGGKTCHVADMLREKGVFGTITACDLTENKLVRIRENIERFGFREITPLVNDATVYRPEWAEKFDLVIADVPCSGLGVLSGKPDIKLHVTEESLRELVEIQKKILENALSYVKKDGMLLYSTCTLNPAENGEQIENALKNRDDFDKQSEITLLPGVNVNGDGFYLCKLRKK